MGQCPRTAPDSAGHDIRAYKTAFRALAIVAGTPTARVAGGCAHTYIKTEMCLTGIGERGIIVGNWGRGEVGYHAGLSSRRPRVQAPSLPSSTAMVMAACTPNLRVVAQGLARSVRDREVGGSNPPNPIMREGNIVGNENIVSTIREKDTGDLFHPPTRRSVDYISNRGDNLHLMQMIKKLMIGKLVFRFV